MVIASRATPHLLLESKNRSCKTPRVALTRALRARRARPPEVAEIFSCFAAARAACVSTWLGEHPEGRAALRAAGQETSGNGNRGVRRPSTITKKKNCDRSSNFITATGRLHRHCAAPLYIKVIEQLSLGTPGKFNFLEMGHNVRVRH